MVEGIARHERLASQRFESVQRNERPKKKAEKMKKMMKRMTKKMTNVADDGPNLEVQRDRGSSKDRLDGGVVLREGCRSCC